MTAKTTRISNFHTLTVRMMLPQIKNLTTKKGAATGPYDPKKIYQSVQKQNANQSNQYMSTTHSRSVRKDEEDVACATTTRLRHLREESHDVTIIRR